NFDLSTGITGVGAVNIVSRGGSNTYHGNAFLFFRDHSLAALSTFNRLTSTFDPFFRRWQYGGSVGGPIKKDKLLFFANVERLDQDAAISVVNTGFSGFGVLNTAFTSPYTGTLLNGRLDYTMTDKHRMFGRFSLDDNDAFAPVGQNQMPSNWRLNTNNDRNAQVGLNSIFKQNMVNDLRFNYQRINNDSLLPTSSDCPATELGCIGLGGPEIRINNSSFRAGNSVNAPQTRHLQRFQTSDLLSWQKGTHRVQVGGEWEHNYGLGSWAFADPAILVLHDPRDVLATNAAVNANLPAPVRPAYTIPLPPAFTTPGAPITANDLLQLPIAFAVVGIGDPSQPPPFNVDDARRSNRYRTFFQDSWQIRDNFTFRYGVSYQYETNLLNHDLAKPALIGPLVGKLEPSGKDTNNFAPSVGFNWSPGHQHKTVIRGGAGVYYDTVLFVTRLRERAAIGPVGNGRSQLTGAFFQNPLTFPQVPGIPPPLSLINPALGVPINFTTIPTKFTGKNFMDLLATQIPILQNTLQALGKSGISGIDFFKTGTDILDPNLEIPYSLNYNIGFARELPYNMAITADFVIRRRLHTLFQNDYNLADRVAARGGPVIPKCVGAQAINPAVKCSNGAISVIQSSGREQYTGLLVKLDKRFANRFSFTASYALSELTGFFTGEDLTNWFGFHGDLGGDARHRFTFSGVLDLPWSFQASLIAVYASRGPFNARVPATIDLNGDGTGNDTLPGLEINTLARGTSKSDLVRLVNDFNTNFAGKQDAKGGVIPPLFLPTRFEFGDNFQSHDIRITKNVKIGERISLQGFVEVFNIFNISNLGGYSSTLDRGTVNGPPTSFSFGQPTVRAGQNFGTGGPRAFQLGGRFSF
ncbi:MAG TPA: hypothetical protein VFV34_05835, partial [Blastocatellia bacterium]|nr:hypothetical protein [Blastocatellia bacterium]